MAYTLTIVGGRGLGTKFLVKTITTIGRERVDVVLDRDDTVISRMHAMLEVTPSQGIVVFSDRSQHGSVVIRASGENIAVKGRAAAAGDPSGSVMLFVGDQIQLGGVTLVLERLTADSLKDEEVEEEAAAVVAGFGGHPPDYADQPVGAATVTGGSGAAGADAEGGAPDTGGEAGGAFASAGASAGGDLGVTPPGP